MIPALISYLLLNYFLARAKAQEGGELDESHKAAVLAKVSKIVDTINHFLFIWFQCILWFVIVLFALVVIALGTAIAGIIVEEAWIVSIELLKFGSLAQIVGEYGSTKVVSVIAAAILLFIGLFALAVWLLHKLKNRAKATADTFRAEA